MKNILRIALGITLLLLAHGARAQTQVYQTGVVTNGHPVGWSSNRFVADLESLGGYSQLTITATTPTFCINDAQTSVAYHQLCLGAINAASTAGTALYGAFGGATSLPFIFAINGGTITMNGNALTAGWLSINGIGAGTAGTPYLSGGGSTASWGTVTGNTTKFVTYTGAAAANGDCATFDTSGNLKTSGASCASSGVGAGTAGNLPYYATTSSSVSANANLNISSGALTIGQAGSVLGVLKLTGSGSGTVTIQPAAAAGTFNFNLPITAGASGQALTSGGGGAASMTWSNPFPAWQAVQSSNFNASANSSYCVDTTSGAITATLPGSPSDGDQIQFTDCKSKFGTNNLVVSNNSLSIMGSVASMTVNTVNASFILRYNLASTDWRLQ